MKIALVGGWKETQMMAPFMDEEWEIWVLGNQITDYNGNRVSRVFEVHDDLSEHDPRYPGLLAGLGVKVIVGDKFPIPEKSESEFEVYPYDEVDEIWGYHYMTSSLAYMIGYALYQMNPWTPHHDVLEDEIAVYGVNMAHDNHEYFKQKACFEAWLGFAKGLGIKVTIPEQSALLRSNYDEARDWGKKGNPFFEENMLEHAKSHAEVAEQAKMKMYKHEGAKEAYESMAKIARGVDAGFPVQLGEINKQV